MHFYISFVSPINLLLSISDLFNFLYTALHAISFLISFLDLELVNGMLISLLEDSRLWNLMLSHLPSHLWYVL